MINSSTKCLISVKIAVLTPHIIPPPLVNAWLIFDLQKYVNWLFVFLEVNPCFQRAHIFCMDLQPAADPYNVVCRTRHSWQQHYEYSWFSQVEVTENCWFFTQKFWLCCVAIHAHTVETGFMGSIAYFDKHSVWIKVCEIAYILIMAFTRVDIWNDL